MPAVRKDITTIQARIALNNNNSNDTGADHINTGTKNRNSTSEGSYEEVVVVVATMLTMMIVALLI